MTWAARAAANLLPLSREQSNLAIALREWRYTGDFHDLEAPAADCKLCDHPDIRYQFEIRNLHTGEALLIGSECINRFGIVATDEEGRALDAAATRKKVARDRRRLVDDTRKKRVITSLVALAHVDTTFDIASFVDYLQTREAFTPKQVATLFWRLHEHKINYSPRDYKLTIRRNREKEQLINLPDWQFNQLKPCLSTSQRVFVESRRGKTNELPGWHSAQR